MNNEYFRAATDLAIRYPLARFARMAEGYSTLLCEEPPEVYIVGFGSLGREVFLSLARNSVFLSGKDRERVRVIDYNIFTADPSCAEKFLNSSYGRCRAVSSRGEDYLPPPYYTSKENIFECGFDEAEATLVDKLGASHARSKVVILCLEDKKENLDLAVRLVRNRDSLSLDFNLLLYSDKACDGCLTFGSDTDSLYEKYLTVAKVRNFAYGRDISNIGDGEALTLAENLWEQLDIYAKRSSLFAAVSLPFKLAALGFTVSHISDKAVAYDEFLTAYNRENNRALFCEQEHYRWCAALITEGYAPPSIERILNEKRVDVCGKEVYTNGKNSEEKLHPHLTDMAGLERFAALVAERDGVNAAERDVIGYDYELLDNAVYMLRAAGLGIYRE